MEETAGSERGKKIFLKEQKEKKKKERTAEILGPLSQPVKIGFLDEATIISSV